MSTLAIGLQEWAVCCRAFGDGRLILTLRKGGIHERGGRFEPEQARFLLLPSYLHQDASRVAPALAAEMAAHRPTSEPGLIRVELWAETVRTWRARDLVAVQSLGPELPWTAEEVANRFRYRSEQGDAFIHVLALRIHRLPRPAVIPDDPAYRGCRSWIELRQGVATAGSVPVVGTGVFQSRLERIAETLAEPRGIVPDDG